MDDSYPSAATDAQNAPASVADSPSAELAILQKELAAQKDDYLRLAADFDKQPTWPQNPGVTFLADATDKRREGMEAALLLRGNPRASREMVEKGREFAGLTLVDMARECLSAAGCGFYCGRGCPCWPSRWSLPSNPLPI